MWKVSRFNAEVIMAERIDSACKPFGDGHSARKIVEYLEVYGG